METPSVNNSAEETSSPDRIKAEGETYSETPSRDKNASIQGQQVKRARTSSDEEASPEKPKAPKEAFTGISPLEKACPGKNKNTLENPPSASPDEVSAKKNPSRSVNPLSISTKASGTPENVTILYQNQPSLGRYDSLSEEGEEIFDLELNSIPSPKTPPSENNNSPRNSPLVLGTYRTQPEDEEENLGLGLNWDPSSTIFSAGCALSTKQILK